MSSVLYRKQLPSSQAVSLNLQKSTDEIVPALNGRSVCSFWKILSHLGIRLFVKSGFEKIVVSIHIFKVP